MTTKTSQISHNILGFFGFIGRWVDQRQQNRAEEEKAKKARWEQELAERAQTEKLLFLKLLQTMCKVCEQLKPLPWVHTFGGWYPGQTVRALPQDKGYTNAHTPIYEIHHESPRLHGGTGAKYSTNFYNITIEEYTPEHYKIYNHIHFVPDDLIPYMRAVFDLTARANMSSPERATNLKQLMNMNISAQLPYQDEHPANYMIHAIQYLEGLLSQNQSK